MTPYLMGIDNGLTLSKAAIFDLSGREIAVAGRKIDLTYPRPGWTERPMDIVWQATAGAIRDAMAKAGIQPEEIIGIGNSGHGNGVYLLDKAGRPLIAVASMDTRAAGIVERWYAAGVHDQAFPYTFQSFWAAQPNALLAWFKENRPELYAQIGSVFLCHDYIKYCLTGEVTTDYTVMSGSSLFDCQNQRYSADLLALYGLEDLLPALPRLVHSHEIAGRVTPEAAAATGLAVGTPVVGGMFDVDAGPLACGVIEEGLMCIIAGTWAINEIVSRRPVVDKNIFMCNLFTVPGLWLVSECSPTSATNLEWFVSNFCGEERIQARERGVSVYDICNELVETLPPASVDVIFHPFLFGSNVQANARAGFYGLGAWHTKAHVLAALYEGVVYSHLSHVDRLRATGLRIERARLTGGGSHSRVWTQMFADALQLPIEVVAGSEIGALGAAMAAGIAAGAYRDHADAVARVVRVERVHEPEPGRAEAYRARYAEYQCLAAAMAEPWNRLAGLTR
ncbi:MAG TPA: FGGY-family carbohydrate kinase [Anaerolineae bacterium]